MEGWGREKGLAIGRGDKEGEGEGEGWICRN